MAAVNYFSLSLCGITSVLGGSCRSQIAPRRIWLLESMFFWAWNYHRIIQSFHSEKTFKITKPNHCLPLPNHNFFLLRIWQKSCLKGQQRAVTLQRCLRTGQIRSMEQPLFTGSCTAGTLWWIKTSWKEKSKPTLSGVKHHIYKGARSVQFQFKKKKENMLWEKIRIFLFSIS